jgi:hypothetical protein
MSLIVVLDELFRRIHAASPQIAWHLLRPSRMVWLEGELLLLHVPRRQLDASPQYDKLPSFSLDDVSRRVLGLSEIKCYQQQVYNPMRELACVCTVTMNDLFRRGSRIVLDC